MLMLLSPAKTLDFSANMLANLTTSIPEFANESQELMQILQKYSAQELAKLMSLSNKLSELNYQRFQEFNDQTSKAALYAYKGDVYDGFELNQYKDAEINFANDHLRIISGLYGILKPLDLIRPYRLEMSINLVNSYGKNLYHFWDKKLTASLNQERADIIVNLASQEYSSVIIRNKLTKPMINIIFKEQHQGEYKIIGIHAKKARGVMANFIIRNFIKTANGIKDFCLNGYHFKQELSSEEEYVFIR